MEQPHRYEVYGCMLPELLIIILRSAKGRKEQEAVCLYYDFGKDIEGETAHCGSIHNEDWKGDVGLGACILSRRPFENITQAGEVDPKVASKLRQFWKAQYGQRMNRILKLFGHKAYVSPDFGHK